MFRDEDAVKIAKIVKIFGLNGELYIRLFDNFPDEIDYQEPLFVRINGLVVPLFLSSFSRRGTDKAVAIFDDIDTQYRAQELIGLDILTFAERDEDDNSELYMEDTAGFAFTDTTSNLRGVIIEYIEHPQNPLFIVECDSDEFYIPAHEDIIKNIDADNRRVDMTLPVGVFEINL